MMHRVVSPIWSEYLRVSIEIVLIFSESYVECVNLMCSLLYVRIARRCLMFLRVCNRGEVSTLVKS
jgi:hypothetical protein